MWRAKVRSTKRKRTLGRVKAPSLIRLPVESVQITIQDLPERFQGLKVCQITDVHLGGSVSQAKLQRIIRQANALGADLFVLTGDYIEGHHGKYADPAMHLLSGLNGPKFAVLGNHDYWGGRRLSEEAADRHGIRLLANEHVMLERGDDRLCIAGLVDYWCDRPDLAAAVAGVPDDVPRLILSHNPDYVEEMPRERADLMIAGHTHGGQVRLFGKHWGPSTYGDKYLAGLVDTGFGQVYISRGVGTSVVPFRIGVPPELTLFELVAPGEPAD